MTFVCGRCHAAFLRLDQFCRHLRGAHGLALWDAGRLAEWREVVAEMRRRGLGE